ncbi:MAG: GxxExxY protein, partial [Candidatus Roizmanbacteria bacterium]|nr:GxxExxY protein [Candidatus Roizmanbacteria bacterium]
MRNHANDANSTALVYKDLSYKITGICFKVHQTLGRFCKEKQYCDLLEKELNIAQLQYKREYELSSSNEDIIKGNIVDFLIVNKIILDAKAKKFITKEDYFQMMRYLRIG